MVSVCDSILIGSRNLLLFCRLQHMWASCRLLMSDGCPPLSIGMMWSMHALIGCGHGMDLSTGRPQMPQVSCDFKMRCLFFSNTLRCDVVLSALAFAISSTPTKKAPYWRFRLSKKVAGRRPFSCIIDMGDALC